MKKLLLCLTICLTLFCSERATSQTDTVFINLSAITGSPGDTVCVAVSFKNFKDIQSAQWTLGFTPSKLEFVKIQKGFLPGISQTNNFFANNSTGTLRFLYDAPTGQTLPDDVTAFSICFRIKGQVNDFDCLRFQETGINTEFTNIANDLLPFKYRDCNKVAIVNSALRPVRLNVDKGRAKKGTEICLPIRVFDFIQTKKFALDLNWDINSLTFVKLSNFNLQFAPQGSATPFYTVNVNAGILQINWTADLSAVSSLSIPDSTVLFTICLNVKGDEGELTCIQQGPRTASIVTDKSNGQNVGLIFNAGCVQIPAKIDPVKLWFCDENKTRQLKAGDEICIPVHVADFDSIGGLKGTLSWDPALFDYVKYSNLTPPTGVNNVIWTFNPDTANGFFAFLFESINYTSLKDSTVIFELCLRSKGVVGLSQGIVLSPIPVPAEAFSKASQGFDIGVYATADNCPILVESIIKLSNALIVQPNCKLPFGGMVTLNINGGIPPYKYQWSAAAGNSTNEQARNLSTGIYYCTVTDNAPKPNLLVLTFDLAGDLAKPIVRATATGQLECSPGSFVALDGTGSSVGPFYRYRWISENGVIDGPDTLLTAKALSAYPYALMVTDLRNGCSDTSRVIITAPSGAPVANAGPEILVPCNFTAPVTLDGCKSTSVGTTFRWSSPNGGKVVSNFTQCDPLVVGKGLYILTVTLTQNGCTAVSKTNVVSDANTPFAKAVVQDTINCKNSFVFLDASNSSKGAGVSYKWTSVQNNAITDDTGVRATVRKAGTYVLVVTNALSCVAVDTVVVYDVSKDTVSAVVVSPVRLNCDGRPAILDGKSSTTGPNVRFSWEVPAGSSGRIISGSATSSPVVDRAGTYVLSVFNTRSFCASKATVSVFQPNYPQGVNAGNDSLLNCYHPQVKLNGIAPAGPDFEVNWSTGNGAINSGPKTLNPLVSGAGTYYLRVTDRRTNCSTIDSLNIREDFLRPTAKIIGLKEITCGADSVTLFGMGSLRADVFKWTTPDGKFSSSTVLSTAAVTTAGTYFLKVQSASNGCTDSVSHQIKFVFPEKGFAGNDTLLCNSTGFTLQGTISGPVKGVWNSLDGASITDVNSNVTTVDSLYPGRNRFVWKLSAKGCPDFSTDTIEIFSERTPVAVNDDFSFANNGAAFPLTVMINDNVKASRGWKIEVLKSPALGRLETGSAKGVLAYLPRPCYNGIQEFQYRICSEICPSKCDTAVVRITVARDPNSCQDIQIPNTITPNGDGKNDVFMIDAIDYQPERFKNAQLLVFNRWGDLVYKSGQPYANNWGGTNGDGKDLPEGTYYYLLDLNLPDGFSYRGDITILR